MTTMLTDKEIAALDRKETGCVWYWEDIKRFARAVESTIAAHGAQQRPYSEQDQASADADHDAQQQKPVAWRYRYHSKGEWHLASESAKGSLAMIGVGDTFEEEPLYAAWKEPTL